MTPFDYLRAAITGMVAWLVMEIGSHVFELYISDNNGVIAASTTAMLGVRGLLCVCIGMILLQMRRSAPGLKTSATVWMLGLLLVFVGVERMVLLLDLPTPTLLYIASCTAAMALGTVITVLRERPFVMQVFGK